MQCSHTLIGNSGLHSCMGSYLNTLYTKKIQAMQLKPKSMYLFIQLSSYRTFWKYKQYKVIISLQDLCKHLRCKCSSFSYYAFSYFLQKDKYWKKEQVESDILQIILFSVVSAPTSIQINKSDYRE